MNFKKYLLFLLLTASSMTSANTVVFKQLTPSLRIIMRDGIRVWQFLATLPDGTQKWLDKKE